MQRICVFTGASPGASTEYERAASQLGRALVERGSTLVYGGAKVGLMGVLADTVLEGGGQVIGVIPEDLVAKEVSHHGVSELKVVPSMHERKAVMSDLSDAVVALPGGLGTLDELFEMLTWSQLGLHQKRCGLLNVLGYFDQLLGFLDHAVAERFIARDHQDMLHTESTATALLDRMDTYRAPVVEKWLDRASS
jgi:hypothetical protein